MELFLKSVISFSGLTFGYRTQIQVKSFFTELHASVKIGLTVDLVNLGLKYLTDCILNLQSLQKSVSSAKHTVNSIALRESPSISKKEILGTHSN